jgi:hypothetical protein
MAEEGEDSQKKIIGFTFIANNRIKRLPDYCDPESGKIV